MTVERMSIITGFPMRTQLALTSLAASIQSVIGFESIIHDVGRYTADSFAERQ